jgi:hypothetical protein
VAEFVKRELEGRNGMSMVTEFRSVEEAIEVRMSRWRDGQIVDEPMTAAEAVVGHIRVQGIFLQGPSSALPG